MDGRKVAQAAVEGYAIHATYAANSVKKQSSKQGSYYSSHDTDSLSDFAECGETKQERKWGEKGLHAHSAIFPLEDPQKIGVIAA